MRCLFIAVLLLVISGAQSQNKKLSVIGSSTSACTGPSGFATCYLGRLDAYQDAIAQPMDLFQLAVGGYTVYKGMPTGFVGPWPNLQPDVNNNVTRALSFAPDVVLVNYPSNGYDTLTIDSIMRCLRTIRDGVIAAGKRCFITTTQPRHTFPFNTLAVREKLRTIRDSILVQFGYYAINFWDGLADPTTLTILPAYDVGDGIHLNDAGHNILFQRVRDKNMFSAALPVKLASFTAKLEGEQVNVSWSVENELPGTKYEVQRCSNGMSYESIYTVTSANAASKRHYETIDNTIVTGWYYYRLRISENGKVSFAPVVKVSGGKNKVALKSISADPLRRDLVIKLAASESMRVRFNFRNSAGVLVRKTDYVLQPGENRIVLSINSLARGIYWAECISDKSRIFTRPFAAL